MADSISAQLSLYVDTTGSEDNKSWNFDNTPSKTFKAAGFQIVTTDYGALTIGDMASTDQGLGVLENLDAANYINYGSTNGEFKLLAGEFAFVRLTPGSTIQARANSASVKINKYLLSE